MSLIDFITAPYSIVVLSTGLVFVIIGLIMCKNPPKKINSLYGYRTSSSMLNQERWDFAQKFSGKLMVNTGVILSLSIILSPFIPYDYGAWISMIPIVIFSIMLIVITERGISNKFN